MLQTFVLLALSLNVAMSDSAGKVSFILDFLSTQNKPTNLIVWRDCYDDSQKLELMRGSFIPTLFSQKDSLNESDFRENPQNILFALDLTCTDDVTERIILKVNYLTLSISKLILKPNHITQIEATLFSAPYRWLMFVEDDKVLYNIRALPDSDIVIARVTNVDDEGFALKQFYKIDEDSSEIHYENYGSWSRQSGIIDERIMKIISRRRSDLKGKTLTSSYVVLNPDSMNHLTDFQNKEIDSILKMNYVIVNVVLDQLNVTKKEIFRNTWGYPDAKTGKWSGMVGDLIAGADIGGLSVETSKLIIIYGLTHLGTPLFIVAERIPLIEYIPFNVATKLKFIFRAPQLSAGNQSLYRK